jgi:hypothetical protein
MPQVDRLDASEVAALVERALAAPTFEASLPRWRTVFVERLDFRATARAGVAWNVQEMSMVARRHPKQAQRIVDL